MAFALLALVFWIGLRLLHAAFRGDRQPQRIDIHHWHHYYPPPPGPGEREPERVEPPRLVEHRENVVRFPRRPAG